MCEQGQRRQGVLSQFSRFLAPMGGLLLYKFCETSPPYPLMIALNTFDSSTHTHLVNSYSQCCGGSVQLTSQNVEIIGRRGAVSDNHVDVRKLLDGEFFFQRGEVFGIISAELQESLWPGRRVLWSHAFHAVRK